jgi:hypothetical protein
MSRNRSEIVLVAVLKCIAAAAVLAVVPVFMPHDWMEACHRRLGMGPLPELPIVVYLTRSLSAMYAFHGGLLWVVSGDLRRYAAVVRYLGWAFVVIGSVTLWIDLHAGMPWFWTVGEGPASIAVGLAILVLRGKVGD